MSKAKITNEARGTSDRKFCHLCGRQTGFTRIIGSHLLCLKCTPIIEAGVTEELTFDQWNERFDRLFRVSATVAV